MYPSKLIITLQNEKAPHQNENIAHQNKKQPIKTKSTL